MEHSLQQNSNIEAAKTVFYEHVTAEQDNEAKKADELSCNQLIKNLLKTNLRLIKLNDISSMLLF